MAGGALQAADDMVRIISNGLTFGLADKAASALGEQNTAAKTAAARDRAGFAGDIASIAGYGGGAKAALKGAALIPTIAKAAFSKGGALAAGLGLGGLAEYNSRTADAATPAAAPKATPAAAAPAKGKPNLDDLTSKIIGAIGAHAASATAAPTFADLVGNLSAAQGGVSLRQLNALGEATQHGAQADYYAGGGGRRAPAPGDQAGRMLEQMYTSQFQKALADPKADPVKAQQEFESKVLQLRKTQFIDPYGLQDGGE